MSIESNLIQLKSELNEKVKLVAVSKTKSPEIIMEAYSAGQRVFGENRVQELVDKHSVLPPDIEWHHIGHLQTNKVKYLAPFVSLIHAVDSIKLLREINKQAEKNERIIPCLFQVHIAEEESKFGLSKDELFEAVEEYLSEGFKNVKVIGLMGMATFTDDMSQVRKEFRFLKDLFNELAKKYQNELPEFSELSMGMSGDYMLAVEEGSTMVRVGSGIFGSRY